MYVVFGSEAFLRREALGRLLAELGVKSGDEWGLAEYTGETEDLGAVLSDVRTPALLAGSRVVLVRQADAFVSRFRHELERYVESPSDCGMLVLECDKFAKTTRLYKRLEPAGGLIECEPDRYFDVAAWVARRAQTEYGKPMEASAAQLLVDLVGKGLDRLDAEAGKLATYVGNRAGIASRDVEEVVGSTRMELVFKVMDAITQRDARGGLELWDRVLANDRAAPYRAVGGLAWGLRRLVQAKQAMARGSTNLMQFGIRDSGGAIARQLARLTLTQWEDMLAKLLRIDVASKSGEGDVPVGVEKFILEGCTC